MSSTRFRVIRKNDDKDLGTYNEDLLRHFLMGYTYLELKFEEVIE